jgi:phosphatidylinositol phosphate synthase
VLTVGSAVTVAQRFATVHRQARGRALPTPPPPTPPPPGLLL